MDYFNPTSGSVSSPDEAGRAVRVTKVKNRTLIKTSCAVEGSISFVRSRKSDGSSWLVRTLGLVPPTQFSEGVAVFGLSASLLARLAQDEPLSAAVNTLLQAGQTLSLQARELTISTANRRDSPLQETLSAAIRVVAARIETLVAGSANTHLGPTRLAKPYRIVALASAVPFGICVGLSEPSLTPFKLIGVSAVFVAALAIVAMLGIRAHLRQHALAGAAVSSVVALSLSSAICVGGLLSMLCNTYGGEKLLAVSHFHVRGNIGVSHGRHVRCWFNPDDPSALSVAGESFRSLPVSCRAVHYHSDSSDQSYQIDINPGLLGAPFVQAIRADDSPM